MWLVNLTLIVLCALSSTVASAAANQKRLTDSIIIMGGESFDVGDIETERIAQEERRVRREAEEAAKEAQRLASEERHRPAYNELAKVFSKIEMLDSYCDQVTFIKFRNPVDFNHLPSDSKIALEFDYDAPNSSDISRRIYKRCMDRTGKWKVSRTLPNSPIEHTWVTGRSLIAYKPLKKRLKITPLHLYRLNYQTISDFVFDEERQLESLASAYAAGTRSMDRFAYTINTTVSDENVTVLEKVTERQTGDFDQNRITISKDDSKIMMIETFFNGQLLTRIDFNKVRFNPELSSQDLSEKIPFGFYIKYRARHLYTQHPFLALPILLMLAIAVTFPVGRFISVKPQSLKDVKTKNKKLLVVFLKLFAIVIVTNLILAAFLYTVEGTGGHPPAILYPVAFAYLGIQALLVIGGLLAGFRLGLIRSMVR